MASHEKEQASSSSRITYKDFMYTHREQFLKCVDAEEISSRLLIDNIIPNKASKNSVEDLYLHMREQGDVKSLRKLYSICSERDGYPKMKHFAKDMLELLDKEEPVDDHERKADKREDDSADEIEQPPPKKPTVDKLTSPAVTVKAITSPSKGSCSTKLEEEEKEEPPKKKLGGEKLVDCDSASEIEEPPPKKPTVDKSTSPTVTVKTITSLSKGSCSTKKEEPPRKQLGGKKTESIRRVLSVVEFRNVVLLGESGVGKSTVGNRILGWGPNRFKTGGGSNQVTHDINTVPVERVFNGHTLRISVTDTIGLFDGKKKGKGVMTKVREHVQKHCRDGITTVLFVLSKGRFLAVEQEVYDCIMKHCGTEDAKSMTALVITRCEEMDDKQKANFLENFKKGLLTTKLVDFVKLGIHLVGFPDYSKHSDSSKRRQLEEMFRDSIQADTDHLLRIVAENYKPKMVQEIMLTSWWENCALF